MGSHAERSYVGPRDGELVHLAVDVERGLGAGLEANKSLVRQALETVINGKNRAAAETYFPLDDLTGPVLCILTAVPDLRVNFDSNIAEGGQVVSGVTGRGTHAGAWEGISPMGKPITRKASARKTITHNRIANGHIASHELVLTAEGERLRERLHAVFAEVPGLWALSPSQLQTLRDLLHQAVGGCA